MADKKSWYSTGYEGIDVEKERQARSQGPQRFWMKEQTRREIVLVDDEPFSIYEHNPRMNGTWTNWFTCLKGITDIAPCCEKLGERTRYYSGYYTMVDLTESLDKKGNKHQYEMKLLPTKMKTLQLLRRKKTDRGSLVGCMFKVFRDTDEDPNCGSEYEFAREADLDKLFKVVNYKGKKLSEIYETATKDPKQMELLKETFQLPFDADGQLLPKVPIFNYYTLLAPKEPSELRQLLGAAQLDTESPSGAHGTGASSSSSSGDQIPF